MSIADLVQAAVIALIVAWSALFAARRLLPASSRRVQARLAGLLDRPSLPDGLRRAARRMQPTSSQGSSCASGCSTCGGCAMARTPGDLPALPFRPGTPDGPRQRQ